MPISTVCPSCQSRLRLPDNAAGRRFRCPKCQGVIPGPSRAPKQLVIRPDTESDPGLTDEAGDSTDELPDQGPLPISAAAREACRESYNPFDNSDDEDDGTPKKNRYRRPKGDYNPFVDSQAPEVSQAGTELFDFGAPEPSSAPTEGEFDFGNDPASRECGPRRKRR